MVAFIDAHREVHGVESICMLLPIAPSTYCRHKAEQRDPTRCSARAHRDEVLRAIIRRIYDENHRVYGPRKVWKQMGREGLREARCRGRRLMREMGLVGAVRGRASVTTTQSQPDAQRPMDLVERDFTATCPESTLGGGLHVCRDLAGLRLRRLCHRHLRAAHRWLARCGLAAHRLRARCARSSHLRSLPR